MIPPTLRTPQICARLSMSFKTAHQLSVCLSMCFGTNRVEDFTIKGAVEAWKLAWSENHPLLIVALVIVAVYQLVAVLQIAVVQCTRCSYP